MKLSHSQIHTEQYMRLFLFSCKNTLDSRLLCVHYPPRFCTTKELTKMCHYKAREYLLYLDHLWYFC